MHTLVFHAPPRTLRALGTALLFTLAACLPDHFDEVTEEAERADAAASDASTQPADADADADGEAGDGSLDAAPPPPRDGAAERDASSVAPDAGSADPVDAAVVTDAAAPRDAAAVPDAAPPPDSAVPPLPATRCREVKGAFCDDFEQGTLTDDERAGWSWVERNQPSDATKPKPKLELVAQQGGVGARALRSTLAGTGVPESARLAYALPNGLKSARIEFDFTPSLKLAANSQAVRLCKVQQETSADWPGVELQVHPDKTAVLIENHASNGLTSQTFPIKDLPTKKTRVQLAVTLGNAGSVSVYYDGMQVFTKTGLKIVSTDVIQTFAAVGLISEGTGPQSGVFDDVVISYVE